MIPPKLTEIWHEIPGPGVGKTKNEWGLTKLQKGGRPQPPVPRLSNTYSEGQNVIIFGIIST